MNVLILIIATQKYIKFFPQFKKSIEQYFLLNYKKTFYILTDHELNNEDNVIYEKIYPLPWPLPSLLRFHLFSNLKIPSNANLIYYFDVDTYLVDFVEEEVIPNNDENITVVSHPYNLLDSNYNSFEININSSAFVDDYKKHEYIHASFFGGYKNNFISMCNDIKKLIDIDLKNNTIARWHDESYLNKYVSTKKCKILDCGYAHPDFWAGDLPVKKKIIHLIKDSKSIRGYRKEKSSGVCIIAAGDSCYSQYAYNLAASIKYIDDDAKIAIFTHGSCLDELNEEQKKIFDHIIYIKTEDLYIDNIMHPNLFKLYLHKYSPFDYNVYIDADSIWISKFKFSQLVDNFIINDVGFVGQCRDVIDLTKSSKLYGFCEAQQLKPHFILNSNIAFQLHGQFILFNKNEENIKFFEESAKIYLYQMKNHVNGWRWFNTPSEELSMTIATLTLPFELHYDAKKFAPVITQDDDMREIDRISSKKLILSINGSENHENANKIGGYICISEEITQRYIKFYNDIINEINNNSSYKLKYWVEKKCMV